MKVRKRKYLLKLFFMFFFRYGVEISISSDIAQRLGMMQKEYRHLSMMLV
jgi:hypothetical protein